MPFYPVTCQQTQDEEFSQRNTILKFKLVSWRSSLPQPHFIFKLNHRRDNGHTPGPEWKCKFLFCFLLPFSTLSIT